jgi:2-(1,2-epoxy-1,2-dihydrophenyl)acetyl-CoA isomerase
MTYEFENIIFSINNYVANIVMNREKSLNALNDNLVKELIKAFELCQEENIKVVTIKGVGKSFSSGGDIKLMASIEENPKLLSELMDDLNRLVIIIRNLEKPVIAGINGFTFGAGLGLSLACDFRIASRSSTFSCAFVNIGLVPDTGTSFFLTKLLGYAKATELIMLGETFDSNQALKMGLVNKVVSDENLDNALQNMANKLLNKPISSISRIKKIINKAIISDLSDQLYLEAFYQKECSKTDNFKLAIKSFLEKKKN